jgi:hypothetical protein
MAAGAYVVSGSAIRLSGNERLEVSLTTMTAEDTPLAYDYAFVEPGTSYGPFEVQLDAYEGAPSLIVGFTVRGSSSHTVICVDSLSLQGPPPATPTPLPTDTPVSTASPLPSTTQSPSPTPSTTPTRTPQPSLTFRNGSFEDGYDGWQKFGGELQVTGVPRVSGLSAGVLSSSTASTKWAYQTVAIDALSHYEFSGYLQAGAGVAAGQLRISWYASADGTGEAISTTDSTASITSGSASYVWLTTGPVQPPPGAKTARTRVLLTPASGAPATLFMDDLEFLVVEPATATPLPATSTALAPPPTVSPALLTPASSRLSSAAVVETPPNSPEPTRVSETSSTRVVATRPPVSEVEGVKDEPKDEGGGVPLIWLVAGGTFVVGLAGAYLQGRRHT